MKRKTLLLLIALFMFVSMRAQTVKWLIQPEYEQITHYSTDIFKCVEHNGRVQLIDWNGHKLLGNVDADAVTDYAGGYALVLKGDKIVGFLAESGNHDFIEVNGDFYVTKYSFFSEGLLAVAERNANGKQGYLDTKGNVYINCNYLEAKPFRHGWAAVRKDGKDRTKYCAYISADKKTENTGIISLGGGGENIVDATSFNAEGYALAKGINGKCVVFNSFRNPEKINVEHFSQAVDPYDGSYKSRTTADVVAPQNAKPSNANQNINVFSENGRQGYQTAGGETVVPCQFSSAQPFYEGRSVVEKDGIFGILRLMDGNFVAHWPEDIVRVYPDEERSQLQFSLEVPSSLQQDKIVLEFDQGNGTYKKEYPLESEFKPAFRDGAEKCTLKGRVTYEGLLLWEGSSVVEVEYITLDLKTPSVTATYADENDNQTVKTVITNTSNVNVMVDAVLKVGGQSAPFKGKLSPQQSKTLSVTVKVTENKAVQASVTAKADGHACDGNSATVSLKKI